MDDVAIKAMNRVAKAATGKPLISSGPTYEIRKGPTITEAATSYHHIS